MTDDIIGNETTSYYLTNQVGSAMEMLSAGGWPVARNTIYPYGMEPNPSVAPNRYRFAGMERDATSGLDHTQFRQYAAQMGRWMTPDPYNGSYDLENPQSFNRYMYVNGNPLAFTDPSGLGSACVNGYCTPWWPASLGPAGSVVSLGLFFANFLNDVFGWWGGPPQFTGSLQPRPNVPSTSLTVHVHGTIPKAPNPTPSIIGLSISSNPITDSLIHNDYTKYERCVAGIDWSKVAMSGSGTVNPGTPVGGGSSPGLDPADFGPLTPQDFPNIGPLDLEVAQDKAGSCLREHPLAALDQNYDGPKPGSIVPLPWWYF